MLSQGFTPSAWAISSGYGAMTPGAMVFSFALASLSMLNVSAEHTACTLSDQAGELSKVLEQ